MKRSRKTNQHKDHTGKIATSREKAKVVLISNKHLYLTAIKIKVTSLTTIFKDKLKC